MAADPDMSELRERLQEIDDLKAAAALLYWDQYTYLPRRGAASRGRHLATLERLQHERRVHPDLGRTLERLERRSQHLSVLERDLLRVVRRDVDRATRFPASFVVKVTEHGAASFEAWSRAREESDFRLVAPLLERTVELSREYSSFFPEAAHPADPLIDDEDEGLSVAELRPLFARLSAAIPPMMESALAQGESDGHPALPLAGCQRTSQMRVALHLAKALGYDADGGRQDLAPHPFAIRMGQGDVRITTRVDPADLAEALFSTLHEAGHAMYEQGLSPDLDGTPLASGVSAGVHESQSRLWENMVGRSRGFWRYALPIVQQTFPELRALDADAAHESVNRVRRSLVRTEADELTYNLHVIIRFELELELLDGRLKVSDLPDAWRERYQRDLGVMPESHVEGVLQDVHWFSGFVGGAFQGYAIGNVLAAQFFAAAQSAIGDLEEHFAVGSFAPLREWLKEHVYAHGRRFTPTQLVERATGEPLNVEPYLSYLRGKYAPSMAPAAASE